MNKKEKLIIAGAGVILTYLFLRQNEEKKLKLSDVSISPTEFYI